MSVLSEAGYSPTEVAEALLEYYQRTPSEVAVRLSETLQLSDLECIRALSELGGALDALYVAARDGLAIADPREIEVILEGLGHAEDDVLHLTSLPTVQRFAPFLGFDSKYRGLPMSANAYFQAMMEPKADTRDMTILWGPKGDYDDGPPLNPALGIKEVCGRDECDSGMSNEDLGSLHRGDVPTYYDVIREPGTGRLMITYWWFYGFQFPCNTILEVTFSSDGAHHSDWEPLAITTTPARDAIESVTFGQHGGWYTRKPGGFETVGERPRAYVARLAHGLYHDRCAWPACLGLPGVQCGYYADLRDPTESEWWDTSANLVGLTGSSEAWIAAEKYGSTYPLAGQEFTVKRWFWGTVMSWCKAWLLPGVCLDWVHNPIYGHPTLERNVPVGNPPVYDGQRFYWEMLSCSHDGCERNQGW